MPTSRASRGSWNTTGLPSINSSPLVGWCTPDSILMKVDLPAPLSPSTQVTFPARTVVEMSDSEMTLPNVLVMLRISSIGASEPDSDAGGGCSVTSTLIAISYLVWQADVRIGWQALRAAAWRRRTS